jgi:hypothetical protein
VAYGGRGEISLAAANHVAAEEKMAWRKSEIA